MTTKTVAYTPEQVTRLTEAYLATPTKETVEALAVEFGKTAKSVIAKAAQLGIYLKAEKALGDRGQATKAELAARITPDVDFQADLVKMTKASILAVLALQEAAVK